MHFSVVFRLRAAMMPFLFLYLLRWCDVWYYFVLKCPLRSVPCPFGRVRVFSCPYFRLKPGRVGSLNFSLFISFSFWPLSLKPRDQRHQRQWKITGLPPLKATGELCLCCLHGPPSTSETLVASALREHLRRTISLASKVGKIMLNFAFILQDSQNKCNKLLFMTQLLRTTVKVWHT